MEGLYRRIEELCRLEGINITQMCRLAGVSRGALTDLKSGRKAGLSAATLTKLSEFFGVSVDYLLGGTPEGAMVKKREEQENLDFLKAYFLHKTGRLPTLEELNGLEEYVDIYLKSLGCSV
ncbi:MAG TPA: helix-turn-helix transcriptional regulator [Clostridiales bacterium]|nr:helix-turn-helix transcriptional regulator [Clostridiales bacterium]